MHQRRSIISVTMLLLLFMPTLAPLNAQTRSPIAATTKTPAPRKLNVLFIAADDMNVDLGTYGHPLVKSPNLDRLARRGVRFDRAYCQYALCNPSRTSLLSGRRPEATQIFGNFTQPRSTFGDSVTFLPEYFHNQGYFTARSGKIMHALFEEAVKWDTVAEGPRAGGGANGVGNNRRNSGGAANNQARGDGEGSPVRWQAVDTENDVDARMVERITKQMEDASRNQDKPFFIAAGFHKPHLPWIVPKKYLDMYDPMQIKLQQNIEADRKDIPAMALTETPTINGLSERERQQAVAAYYASISFTDAQVGLLMNEMDKLKLWDNTVVVFFGDHGFQLGEHGLWRKETLFEESTRAPLIVVAPNQKANVASSRLVEFVDIYPTLVELCGLPMPPGLEGTSFAPLLANPEQAWKRAAFTDVIHKGVRGRSLRTDQYRYTEWGDNGQLGVELYDHRTDPQELTNLANDPKHASTVTELKRLLHNGWQAALPASAKGRS